MIYFLFQKTGGIDPFPSAIDAARIGIIKTIFHSETETNLFGEQAGSLW